MRVADDAAESVPQVAWPLVGVFVKACLAGLQSWAFVPDHFDVRVRNRGRLPDCLDPLPDWVRDKDGKREVRHSLVGWRRTDRNPSQTANRESPPAMPLAV